MPSNPYRVTITNVSTVGGYGFFAPDYMVRPFNLGVGVTLNPSTSTAVYTVEHTFDYVQPNFATFIASNISSGAMAGVSTNPYWFANSGLSGLSSQGNGNYAYPVTAIRLNVSATGASTANQVTMTIVSAG